MAQVTAYASLSNFELMSPSARIVQERHLSGVQSSREAAFQKAAGCPVGAPWAAAAHCLYSEANLLACADDDY